jgi:hypothetical protein
VARDAHEAVPDGQEVSLDAREKGRESVYLATCPFARCKGTTSNVVTPMR